MLTKNWKLLKVKPNLHMLQEVVPLGVPRAQEHTL